MRIRRAWEIPRGSNTNARIFLNYVSFPLSSLFHIPRLLTQKYDKIFLYQLSPVMMSFAGIVVGKIKKTETTMYVLDLWPQNLFSVLDIRNSFLRKAARKVSHWHYKNVDKIVTISQKMKEQMHEITALPDDKIVFVPQCCEKFYEEDVYDEELSERFGGGFNIVFAGNISPAQSFETVIDAAKRLKLDGIDDINWIIVGDGMSRSWLEDAVAAAGLQDSFFFEGFKPVRDIPRYHTIADALIACLVKSDLLDCTIPAKVMSYFAAGRPMLLAMDGEAQRLANETGCGFACDSNDSTSLYENIKKLYDLPKEERERMGERGREYHFEHFERNANLTRLHDFIFEEK
jgi:glycosyltransferase involved in cell wall biosynthesis